MTDLNLLRILENLQRNSSLSKYAHYGAATRNAKLNKRVGIPALLINLLLGSVLFVHLAQELTTEMKWIGALLALVAAALGASQTFFRFNETFAAHRRIANQYLEIERECEWVSAAFRDDVLGADKLASEMQALNTRYASVNASAEPYHTTDPDYKRALRKEDARAANA